MVEPGGGSGDDSGVSTALGQTLLDLANRWQQLQKDGFANQPEQDLMRDVYGALALQLAVRARELRGPAAAASDELSRIEKELRTGFADVVSKIR